MMNDTPSPDPAAAPVLENPLRPTPRLMIGIVLDVVERQHQSMTSMRGSLKLWTLSDRLRAFEDELGIGGRASSTMESLAAGSATTQGGQSILSQRGG